MNWIPGTQAGMSMMRRAWLDHTRKSSLQDFVLLTNMCCATCDIRATNSFKAASMTLIANLQFYDCLPEGVILKELSVQHGMLA